MSQGPAGLLPQLRARLGSQHPLVAKMHHLPVALQSWSPLLGSTGPGCELQPTQRRSWSFRGPSCIPET